MISLQAALSPPCSAPQIDANFGTDLARRPFRADVGAIRREAAARLAAKVLHTALPSSKARQAGGGRAYFFKFSCN